jgi:hypothetical protein
MRCRNDRHQADEHQDAAGQVQRLEAAADAGLAQDVLGADADEVQHVLERLDGAAEHQDAAASSR